MLGVLVEEDIPALGIVAESSPGSEAHTVTDDGPSSAVSAGDGGCASCSVTDSSEPFFAFGLGLLVSGLLLYRRRNSGGRR
jgi:hypothetical protein